VQTLLAADSSMNGLAVAGCDPGASSQSFSLHHSDS